jgi:hypothetical protein
MPFIYQWETGVSELIDDVTSDQRRHELDGQICAGLFVIQTLQKIYCVCGINKNNNVKAMFNLTRMLQMTNGASETANIKLYDEVVCLVLVSM